MFKPAALVALAVILAALPACTPQPDDPLGKAAVQGNLTEMNRILAENPSIDERNSALVWAARFGQPESISLLVKNGADPNTTWGVNDWTPLMHAIHKDQPRAVIALLNSGANVNLAGGRGGTPLTMAAGYGYTDIVRILLDHGANAHAVSSSGENALDAALSGSTDIDRFTWGSCQGETVRLLRQRAPDLRPKDSAKLKKCS
ncbi:MAG: ankyrin repeat domain-containing protein [Acidobacteriaceae bacterium]|nr:ankyrin repeat domain-containing protein [Acidobacteriaceae bacterium]MBV9779537.1 ankyrin repeat domain-containing protein [Acidobacteriaceae bacterium]